MLNICSQFESHILVWRLLSLRGLCFCSIPTVVIPKFWPGWPSTYILRVVLWAGLMHMFNCHVNASDAILMID